MQAVRRKETEKNKKTKNKLMILAHICIFFPGSVQLGGWTQWEMLPLTVFPCKRSGVLASYPHFFGSGPALFLQLLSSKDGMQFHNKGLWPPRLLCLDFRDRHCQWFALDQLPPFFKNRHRKPPGSSMITCCSLEPSGGKTVCVHLFTIRSVCGAL